MSPSETVSDACRNGVRHRLVHPDRALAAPSLCASAHVLEQLRGDLFLQGNLCGGIVNVAGLETTNKLHVVVDLRLRARTRQRNQRNLASTRPAELLPPGAGVAGMMSEPGQWYPYLPPPQAAMLSARASNLKNRPGLWNPGLPSVAHQQVVEVLVQPERFEVPHLRERASATMSRNTA